MSSQRVSLWKSEASGDGGLNIGHWCRTTDGKWVSNKRQAENCEAAMTDIKWLEENKAVVLQPEERQWLSAPIASAVWEKNMRLVSNGWQSLLSSKFLDILEIPVDAESDVREFVKVHSEDIVSRLIEESWVNPDNKIEVSSQLDQNESELYIGRQLYALLLRLSDEQELTIEEAKYVVRSRFLESPHPSSRLDSCEIADAIGRKKLAELQRLINCTISQMQEVTANIQTDIRQARTTGG